tara:strand:+ start:1293 stop:1943 length:651 start_codon:yes stop_codon:yes gene_type:complete
MNFLRNLSGRQIPRKSNLHGGQKLPRSAESRDLKETEKFLKQTITNFDSDKKVHTELKNFNQSLFPTQTNPLSPGEYAYIGGGNTEVGCVFFAITDTKGQTTVTKYNPILVDTEVKIPDFTKMFGPECSVTVFWNKPELSGEQSGVEKILQSTLDANPSLKMMQCYSSESSVKPDILVKAGSNGVEVVFIKQDSNENSPVTPKAFTKEFVSDYCDL